MPPIRPCTPRSPWRRRNPYLANLSGQIRRQISLGFGAEPYSREIRRRAVKDHTALAEAVIDGRGPAAARVAERHFRLTETVLRDLVSTVSVSSHREGAS